MRLAAIILSIALCQSAFAKCGSKMPEGSTICGDAGWAVYQCMGDFLEKVGDCKYPDEPCRAGVCNGP
ncbi:hypothetical protein PG994_001058 [Apiospora phragmitis]|uniref:Uncharacterized protein n=1 Tax=Apiospora phragmitis TaxID=2905665 RepID=A0ABR1WSG2_9PEZI